MRPKRITQDQKEGNITVQHGISTTLGIKKLKVGSEGERVKNNLNKLYLSTIIYNLPIIMKWCNPYIMYCTTYYSAFIPISHILEFHCCIKNILNLSHFYNLKAI